jgi:hypothetical protein
MKDQTIHFRTTSNLAEAIKKMAECEGLTVSEFICNLIENKRKEYRAVEVFALNVHSNKKPESIGVHFFKDGKSENGEGILKIAEEKVGRPAIITTHLGKADLIPFSDTLSVEGVIPED